MKNENKRVAIFIDGSNLYYSLRNLKMKRIDFQKLSRLLTKDRVLIKAFYYNAPLDISINKEQYWEMQKFLDELKKIPGFEIVLCKRKKYIKEDKSVHFEMKGDDVYLAIDMVSGAYENLFDVAILVSGDEDFVPVIKRLQKLGKVVENAYFKKSSSNALKNCADYSICLNDLIREVELK